MDRWLGHWFLNEDKLDVYTHVSTDDCLTVFDTLLGTPVNGLGTSGCDFSGRQEEEGLSIGSSTVPSTLVIIPGDLGSSSDTMGSLGLEI